MINLLKDFKPDTSILHRLQNEKTIQINGTAIEEFDFQLPEKAIPREFFKTTLNYLSTQTDAAKEFLFTSLLAMLAAIIGNRVDMRFGKVRVKPNLYALCLAGSTVARKSTALGIVTDYLTAFEKDQYRTGNTPFDEEFAEPEKILMPNSGSTEGLIETMREQRDGESKIVRHSGLAIFQEFAFLLAQCQKDYNAGMKEFYIDTYDGRDHERKLKKEESIIRNPCLSMLGASTLAQFERHVTIEEKYSGFLQRFIFCYVTESKTKPKSLVDLAEKDSEIEDLILQTLSQIFAVACQIKKHEIKITLSENAKVVYKESFNRDHETISEIQNTDPDTAGLLRSYFDRLDIVKMKIALIYTVVKLAVVRGKLEPGNEISVTAETMRQAVETVEYYQGNVKHLLTKEFQFTVASQKQKRLLEILERNDGRIEKRKLLRNSNWSGKDFNEVLNTLIESELVEVKNEPQQSGRDKVYVVKM